MNNAKLQSKYTGNQLLSLTPEEITVLYDALIVSQQNAREQIDEIESGAGDSVTADEWLADIGLIEGIKEQIKDRKHIVSEL